MKDIRFCEACGGIIDVPKATKYCSRCKYLRMARKKEVRKLTLTEAAILAREAGTSYGKYIAGDYAENKMIHRGKDDQ